MPFERVVPEKVYVIDKDGNIIDQGKREAVLPVPEGGSMAFEPAVEITWNREFGQMQIGIELSRQQIITMAEELQTEDWSDVATRGIYTGTLNRTEVNNMIRVLRRARNAAFGADE